MPATLFVVATPIGNLEDITARALRTLGEVALIAAEDTRRTAHLLARYAISTPTTSLHEHNEQKKTPSLIARLQRGESIALVSDAGTPTISDPGQRLIREAIDAGIRVEAIPGPSAVMAALAASGLPGGTFTFLGFPPTRSKDRKFWFHALRTAGRTVVFFEAPHRIGSTLRELHEVIGDRHVAVARELTKTHEEWVRGPISSVIDQLDTPRGEFTVVVEIGQITEQLAVQSADRRRMLNEFGEMTSNYSGSRTHLVRTIARRYGVPRNEVYAVIEQAKKSGK